MSPRERILNPYVRRVDDLPHRLRKLAVIALMLFLAAVMGFLLAVLPVEFYALPFFPLILILLLVLWLAPDIDPELDRPIRFLFLFTLGASMLWPHYTALVVPGIGFVSPYRLSLFLLSGLFLFSLATSRRIRQTVRSALDSAPVTKWTFFLFLAVKTILGIVWVSLSSRYLIELFYWHLLFIMALFCFSQQNVARNFAIMVLVFIPWYTGVAYWEHLEQNKAWMPYIPEFLQGDPRIWNSVQRARFRLLDYRASGMFTTSLALGEMIGFAYPFVLWSLFHFFRGWKKIIGVVLLAFLLLGLVAAGSRTGWAGIVVGTAVFMLLWSYRRWKREAEKRDLVGPAALWAYPFGFVAAVLIVLLWQRARSLIIGGSITTASDAARDEQWRRTWNAVEANPFGYGFGRAWDVIQYTNPRGGKTIDGYYMNLLVEYGIPGTMLFMLFFVSAIVIAARTYVLAANRDEEVAGAVATALVAYLVAKYGYSQTELQHLDFALAGMAVALGWRQKVRLKALGEKLDISPPRRAPPPRPRLRPALS